MKSTATPIEEKELKFPCLMIHPSGTIILATGMAGKGYIGTCVLVGKISFEVGQYLECWAPTFTPYNGTVTLSND